MISKRKMLDGTKNMRKEAYKRLQEHEADWVVVEGLEDEMVSISLSAKDKYWHHDDNNIDIRLVNNFGVQVKINTEVTYTKNLLDAVSKAIAHYNDFKSKKEFDLREQIVNKES